MGVSYFACDGCKIVMHDAGGWVYEHLEFYEDKEYHNGTYCESCANDIKSNRVPEWIDCEITFLLKKEGQEQRKWIMSAINRQSLLDCMQELQLYDSVCVGETNKIDKIALDPENWQIPADAYKFFLEELLDDPEEEVFKWIEPPAWTTKKTRCVKLEEDIFNLEKDIHLKQDKLRRKKRKLELSLQAR